MGRSVSTPSGCTAICYQDASDVEDEIDFQMFVESLQERAKEKWQSFEEADRWLGREDHVILENELAMIGVSEYCGLVAIWLKSKHEDLDGSYYAEEASRAPLAEKWAELISGNFDKMFSQYNKIGTFSNGESVFQLAAA